MKQVSRIVLIAILSFISVNLMAQDSTDKTQKREAPTPEKMAKQFTDEMQTVVGLNEKQYNQIYKLNLKELKTNSSKTQTPMGGGPGGMPPMGGGNFEGGGGPGGGSGDMDDNSAEDTAATQKKALDKKNKKLKKILTDEQFTKWEVYEAEKMKNAPQRDSKPSTNDQEK
jgi:hypothetical protein